MRSGRRGLRIAAFGVRPFSFYLRSAVGRRHCSILATLDLRGLRGLGFHTDAQSVLKDEFRDYRLNTNRDTSLETPSHEYRQNAVAKTDHVRA